MASDVFQDTGSGQICDNDNLLLVTPQFICREVKGRLITEPTEEEEKDAPGE